MKGNAGVRGFRVVSTHRLPVEARQLLESAGAEVVEPPEGRPGEEWLLQQLGEARVVIAGFTRITRRHLEAAGRLELIVARSSGVDHINVEEAERRGVCVANQPEAIAVAVAEHALGLVLSALRRITWGHWYASSGGWARRERPGFARGESLVGKTVGIVGMGRIGVEFAQRARSMGTARILYWGRRRKPEVEQLLKAEPSSLERLFRESNVILVALPRARETLGLIGYRLLSLMREGSVLVNVGRGGVVVEEDILKLLRERSDVTIALDVFEEEPLPEDHPIAREARVNPNLILTPHNAGATRYSLEATAILAARQVVHYMRSGEVWNPVNRACRQAGDVPGLWQGL